MGDAAITDIKGAFADRGRGAAFCTLGALAEVSREFEARHSAGEISDAIFDRYLKGFAYSPPDRFRGACSVLVVASPIGRSVIEFETEGRRFEAVIPPTYGADELVAENEAVLGSVPAISGTDFSRAWLPLKSLAARTGLGRYGRDNVLRFEGMGSFVRLDAWWIGLDAGGEYWGPARVLERCATCGSCERVCPNGCFTAGKFLLDARRCLTFMNEGDEPFPSWLDAEAHNAAVGCLRCQDACPENAGAKKNIYRRFNLDREASALLLRGTPIAGLPPEAAAAVRAAEMAGSEKRLARNLKALVR
jgi:epoxyqueuosine reductase